MANNKKLRFVLDRKLSIPIFILTLISATVLRVYQIQTNVDINTGLYINRDIMQDYPLMAIVIGLFLIALILIFGKSEDKISGTATMYNPMGLPAPALAKNYRGGSGAAMLVCAGTFIFDIFMRISLVVRANNLKNTGITDDDLKTPVLEGLTATDWVDFVLLAFAAITLFTVAANMFKGEGVSKLNCFFLLSIPVMKTLEVFAIFFETQEETRIINLLSERMYIVFADIILVFFFLAMIRVFASMEERFSRLSMIFWGYAAVITISVSVIPRFVMYVLLPYDQIGVINLPDIADIGLAVAVIAIILGCFTDFSYREMERMTYKEGRREHWITELAKESTEMDEISIESADDEIQKEEKAQLENTNIDDLF
ncbi:MAG: hypothetical protein LBM41_05905 [Ruminococcus sp.]|nr:hypothetical protein [Ruminococcus sp.]